MFDFLPNLILDPSLFNSMLFSLHDFECLGFFPFGLVCSFSALWSEKMLDMISIFLNLLRLVLCPIMWSIFVKGGIFIRSQEYVSLKMFHVYLKRMYILLLWGERLYIYIN